MEEKKVLAAVCGCEVPQTIEEKRAMLLANHIAVWDVIDSCDITGSTMLSFESDPKALADELLFEGKDNVVRFELAVREETEEEDGI